MSRQYRVKLITLPWELEVPTLSLASLAAVTPPQIDVAIVDLLRERLFLDEAVDLVGISASTPRVNAAYKLADIYRSKGVKVVMGGHHATAMPEEALEHADAVVLGEGETSWRRICDQLLTNPELIGGIYADEAPDTSDLPQPRIDLMKIERYGAFYYPIIASRGCPEQCSFCFAKRMTSGYRTYPIAHVIEQVRRRPAWVRAMYFVDDNLPGDTDYARELFRELKKYKVPFGMQARHEFSRSDADLRLAAEAGCILISSGYESVNQKTLNRTGKKALADDYQEVIQHIFDRGIIPSGNWMFGFDWDGPEIFEETLAFFDKVKLLHCSFTTEIPFPGTPAFRKYKAEGRLLTENYDEYVGKDHVVVRPKLMTPEQLRDGVRWLALQFYSPGRATRRGWSTVRSPAFNAESRLHGPALAFLNYFQMLQWHYRFNDPMQWLYRRVASVNRYRYFKDHLRRTNFWTSEHVRAEEAARLAPMSFETKSPFLRSGGAKRRTEDTLVPLGVSCDSAACQAPAAKASGAD